jgi:hypothetical protein
MLDISYALLNFAFDLLRHSLHLLIRITGRLADSLLYLASDVFESAFDLVLVHSILRDVRKIPQCQIAPKWARAILP